jgi:hypothetical protein
MFAKTLKYPLLQELVIIYGGDKMTTTEGEENLEFMTFMFYAGIILLGVASFIYSINKIATIWGVTTGIILYAVASIVIYVIAEIIYVHLITKKSTDKDTFIITNFLMLIFSPILFGVFHCLVLVGRLLYIYLNLPSTQTELLKTLKNFGGFILVVIIVISVIAGYLYLKSRIYDKYVKDK